ncbi:MAG: preprotein translocase subunit SecG [Candidatus Dependentiae bacterium]|nr:preprotein translocase subunit SecG [Candidatus Dependentiae bacterium]
MNSVLYGLLVAFYVFLCFVLMGIILIQKSKGSLGIGNIGGSMQMLFGGSGGQSLLQKVTWAIGGLFMLLSLVLALAKSSQLGESRYMRRGSSPMETPTAPPVAPMPLPLGDPTGPTE